MLLAWDLNPLPPDYMHQCLTHSINLWPLYQFFWSHPVVTNDEVNRAMEHGLDLAPPIASLRWQANGHIAKDKDLRDSSVEISLDETK